MAKKYLDPKADVTFKKVFGEHKNLVISFLNALLPLDPGKQIESIEYMSPELVPQTPTRKNTIVDVRCEETGGRKFLVEMQMEWTTSFRQRVLFNASKAYVRQLPKGKDYELLQPVYSLDLVNATFEPDLDEYYHYYSMVNYLHSDKVLEGLHLVFVELTKFKAKNLTDKKMQVLWLRFLTEISETTKEAPQDLVDNPQVNEALEIVEESAYSEEELYAYDEFWDAVSCEKTIAGDIERARAAEKAKLDAANAERDAANAERDAANAERDVANAERDAANAERDVALEKLRRSVRQMKADGMAVETIARYTCLTADEISAL